MRYEYFVTQDDNAMSTATVMQLFDRMGEGGWRFVGTVGNGANHIIWEKPVLPYEKVEEVKTRAKRATKKAV